MQYPHDIKVTTKPITPKNSRGNYTAQADVETWFKGRLEAVKPSETGGAQASGSTVVADGKKVQDLGTIYCAHGTGPVPVGAKVEVLFAGETLASGTAKGFSKGFYNCRLWLQA